DTSATGGKAGTPGRRLPASVVDTAGVPLRWHPAVSKGRMADLLRTAADRRRFAAYPRRGALPAGARHLRLRQVLADQGRPDRDPRTRIRPPGSGLGYGRDAAGERTD